MKKTVILKIQNNSYNNNNKMEWIPVQLFMAALRSRCGHYILSFFSFLFCFPRLITAVARSQIGCLPYFNTWCGLSANLGCRSETCCTRLAGNTRRKKSPSGHHRTTLSGYIFATKARNNNRKKIVKQQYPPNFLTIW